MDHSRKPHQERQQSPAPENAADRSVAGVEPYDGPAGGWGALKAVALAVRDQMGASTDTRALLKINQPTGFDCPGCAWPDPKKTSSFEFCENGAKAVTWEATTKSVDTDFFARHSASELWEWNDHQLEDAGRLTHPLAYDRNSDHFVPISWDEAYARIGADWMTPIWPNSTARAGRPTKRRFSISCWRGPMARTIFQTAPTCATKGPV